FLRKDSLHRFSLARRADEGKLSFWRDGDIEHFDRWIVQQLFGLIVNFRDVVLLSHLDRPGASPGGDGYRIKSCFAIRDQVTVANDETAAHDADAEIFPLGEWGMNAQ